MLTLKLIIFLLSKELVTHVLGLQKGRKYVAPASVRCPPLEQQMVELLVEVMEMAEKGEQSEEILTDLFRNVASDLIFFVLFQFVSFPHVISDLAEHIERTRLRAGRDKLMWVLLQFISGSIAKNPTGDFMPVLRLYWYVRDSQKEKERSLDFSHRRLAALTISF